MINTGIIYTPSKYSHNYSNYKNMNNSINNNINNSNEYNFEMINILKITKKQKNKKYKVLYYFSDELKKEKINNLKTIFDYEILIDLSIIDSKIKQEFSNKGKYFIDNYITRYIEQFILNDEVLFNKVKNNEFVNVIYYSNNFLDFLIKEVDYLKFLLESKLLEEYFYTYAFALKYKNIKIFNKDFKDVINDLKNNFSIYDQINHNTSEERLMQYEKIIEKKYKNIRSIYENYSDVLCIDKDKYINILKSDLITAKNYIYLSKIESINNKINKNIEENLKLKNEVNELNEIINKIE